MSLKLSDIPVMVINLPGMSERRANMTLMLGAQGISPTFVDGVRGQGKIRGAAAAHSAAFDAAPSTPFLVLEDDVGMLWDDVELPSIPAHADVIYLGTHTGGVPAKHGRKLGGVRSSPPDRLCACLPTGATMVAAAFDDFCTCRSDPDG